MLANFSIIHFKITLNKILTNISRAFIVLTNVRTFLVLRKVSLTTKKGLQFLKCFE